MHGPQEVAAEAIRDHIDALVDATFAIARRGIPEGEAPEEPSGRYRSDATSNLLCLAAAVELGAPAVLACYIEWLAQVLEARGIPAAALASHLEALEQALREAGQPALAVAAEYVRPALQLLERPLGEPPSPVAGASETQLLARRYIDALLEQDRPRASALVLGAVGEGLPVARAYLEVLQPAQLELGRRWQMGRLTPPEESYATGATAQLMAQLYPQTCGGQRPRGSVVAACVAPEQHDLGLRMVADFLEMDGWYVHHLGGCVPGGQLAEAVRLRRPRLVLLSVALAAHLHSLREAIRQVRATGSQAAVLVGGFAINTVPELWRLLGADGYAADAREAVAIAGRLVAEDGSARRGPPGASEAEASE